MTKVERMVISPSSEFVDLCRSQVALLTQGLGAALGIVYLTEEFVEAGNPTRKLIPLVAYPETAVVWQSDAKALPGPKLLATTKPTASATDEERSDSSLVASAQIVLPLMHDGVMVGLLVAGREDRPWNDREKGEIESIAHTIAIARLLDQRREYALAQLNQQQRSLARQRDLLDDLLHQFRNPLTALRTFGKLLLKRFKLGDANRAVAESIVRESDRLQELLQQFDRAIDMTAEDLLSEGPLFVEATIQPPSQPRPLLPGATGGKKELCWVADVLEPLLTSARAIALERNLQLHAEIPPDLPAVQANAKALREVLSNLIDNALKYTPAGGEIFIQAGQEQNNFQGIAISDTGLGIPPQDLDRVFERHYRGVQEMSEIAGTGLGLAIAKELVEQMQGEIQVFSPAQNQTAPATNRPGTTFIVWLRMSH